MTSEDASTAGPDGGSSPEEQPRNNNSNNATTATVANNNHTGRKERPSRACTARSSARLYTAASAAERKSVSTKKEKEEQLQQQQYSKIITPLVNESPSSQLPRWSLRSMWELASLLNFLHIFRPLLNISAEFSAEELETALITPNSTLDDIHIPLLKVAEGEIPIVASHGMEVEVYKALDPGTRVVILKALCDIRVEQEDIRNYIDSSIKHGVQLSGFRKERIGGDSHGISYWYEDDPIIGHRLYRENRKIEVKKLKGRGMPSLPNIFCQWETVASNLDEFQEVAEKLFSSKNRTEVAVGKKLKNDMLPEIEKIHKRKERLLKKQHRQALLLDNYLNVDGLAAGRSLRDRKPVTYTFDDFDRSINEAIKITKRRQSSPEHVARREVAKHEALTNGRWNGPSQAPQYMPHDALSPKATDHEETDGEHKFGNLDRSNRRRQRPEKYSEFVEAVSDEVDFDSDDDIVGEAVYDEEYIRSRKQRKVSSSSEGDEEYHWDEENAEDEEDDEYDDSFSSEDTDELQRPKNFSSRRRGTKLRSVDEIQSGLRRSKRATRNRINYRHYELSDSETETKPEKSNTSDGHSDASNNVSSMASGDSRHNDEEEMKVEQAVQDYNETVEKEQPQPPEKANGLGQEEVEGVQRRFLDLNELAPGSGFDDGPGMLMKDEDSDNF